jgi:hypothetical protein
VDLIKHLTAVPKSGSREREREKKREKERENEREKERENEREVAADGEKSSARSLPATSKRDLLSMALASCSDASLISTVAAHASGVDEDVEARRIRKATTEHLPLRLQSSQASPRVQTVAICFARSTSDARQSTCDLCIPATAVLTRGVRHHQASPLF